VAKAKALLEFQLAMIKKENNILYIACISGGKDSTAMLISIRKYNLPVDYILFADTGVEFDEVYKTIEDIDIWAKEHLSIGITKIKAKHDFIYYLTKYKRKRGKFVGKPYIFPTPRFRWCTWVLKICPMRKFAHKKVKELNKDDYIFYIGYRPDEIQRLRKKQHKEIYPLVEYNINNTLDICLEEGFSFYGLYEKFTRISCWLCPFQSEKDLYILKKYYPEKFKYLLELDRFQRKTTGHGFGFRYNNILEKINITF